MKNIVIIGGGTGTFTLLSGLRKYPSNNSVIVSSADDGGSTGILRKELGVMPPGDIRQCLVGLSYTEPAMRELFSYRFDKGSLAGHNAGNIILAALEKITGSIDEAISLSAKMLNVRGQVLPASLTPTVLTAELQNGKILVGEHNIDDQNPKGKASAIKNLKLSAANANPKAIKAIEQADTIIFGPGDLYTSILPNILVKGMKEAINKSAAQKIVITNIVSKFGQTDGFKASDFVRIVEQYLGGKIDTVIVNNQKPAAAILKRYKKEKAAVVVVNVKEIEEMKVKAVTANLLSSNAFEKNAGDKLKRSFLRHDCDKLAKLIWGLAE